MSTKKNNATSSNRVLVNTFILYVRMILTVGVSLYSTRVILLSLGVADYGIFNLIAGIISMLSFLNTAMSISTQRYLSFYQGKDDLVMQKRVFTNALLLHFLIGLIIAIGLEVAGLFLFDGFLNIPIERITTAKVLYHFMVLTVFSNVSVVPFIGTLYAHENMLWIALVNTIEALLKLAIAFILVNTNSDKLILYGFLTVCLSFVSAFLYIYYCFRKYGECTFVGIGKFDKSFISELTSFAGWNLFGSLCVVGRIEGVAVLLNLFFGTVVNAAFGIANQVASQLNFFAGTMLQAINPQIMKSEGSDDRAKMLRLSMIASKFSFFLLGILAIPCIFEMKNILQFWLKNVPEFTVIFCRLILIGLMINQLTVGLQSAIQATGKIKFYQLTVGSVILLNLPLAYIFLKLGYPAYTTLVIYAVIELVACSLRLYFMKLLGELSISEYFSRVILKEIVPVVSSVIFCCLITTLLQINYRFILTISISSIIFLISIYLAGLCEDEMQLVNTQFVKLKNRFTSKNKLSI